MELGRGVCVGTCVSERERERKKRKNKDADDNHKDRVKNPSVAARGERKNSDPMSQLGLVWGAVFGPVVSAPPCPYL